MLYDLAFLLMDLHTRGLDALGNAVFNRYLDLHPVLGLVQDTSTQQVMGDWSVGA